ncbi:MAG TPA: SRPBCC domain-containing protein [Rhizomicrobium sp.]|jgi:glutathione S-transferase
MNAPVIDASVHLSLTRVFEVSPEVLFDAWFTREQWQAWIGPEGCRCDVPLLEPHPGGRYRINMNLADGQSLPVEGVFKVVDRPHSLSFTWRWALGGKGDTLVRLSFRAVANGTELTLIHEGLPTEEARADHGKGWNSVFNKLARYVKGETP